METLAARVMDACCDLLVVPSVVGHEAVLLDHLAARLRRPGLEIIRHPHALEVSGGDPTAPILSAHADRHGLIADGSGALQYAAFVVKRLRDHEDPPGSRAFLERIAERFIGEEVHAFDPRTGSTMGSGRVDRSWLCPIRDNLAFRVPGLTRLPEGTPVRYDAACEVGEESLSGQLDNVLGVALGVVLVEEGFRGRIVFTCEEEAGMSWKHLLDALAGTPPSRRLLVLDTSPFPEDAEGGLPEVVLRRRDGNGRFAGAITEEVIEACGALGLTHVIKDEWVERTTPPGETPNLGRTELGRVVRETGGAWNGTTVQIPTVGYHTNRERAEARAVVGVYALLEHLLG
ncbi:MAG: hypothetical protein RQ745_04715 [Longimicrobiales bacterium]|nr:hypothetical protein [Longimicrobiales bacterium]